MTIARRRTTKSLQGRRRRTFRLGALAILALAFGLGNAFAQTPSSTVTEQHWELLRETKQLNSATAPTTTSIQMDRGDLPGATTKFDPQPTATLEVEAKVTAALGNGRWTVDLVSSTTTLATVTFLGSDTSYSIKTAAISWPSTDKGLDSLVVTKVQPGAGDVAGVIDVRKAYVKIHQTGPVKKIVGRVPMAPKVNVNYSGWTDLPDPTFFEYDSTEYNPAPTIKLRIDGCSAASGTVRLVDDLGVSAGTITLPPACGSHDSSALTLTSGRTYHVQVNGNSSIFGGDLVFEQETTDTLGIYRTVGWYPSVVVPTEISTATATDLDHQFRSPATKVWANSWSFVGTMKAGTSQPVTISLHNRAYATNEATLSTSSLLFEYQDAAIPNGCGAFVDCSPGMLLHDTQAAGLNGARVSMSALKVVLSIRDTANPTLGTLTVSPAIFSPNNDSNTDWANYSVSVSDDSLPLNYSVNITDTSNNPVRTLTGTTYGGTLQPQWNGQKDPLTPVTYVTDGQYNATITLTDPWGNSATSGTASVIADLIPPTVTLTAPTSSVISGQTTLTASASDNHSSVNRVEFNYRRVFSDGTTGPWHLLSTDTTAPYATTLRTVSLADGPIEVGVKSVDGVGNGTEIIDLHSFEVRNGDLLGHQGFATERAWQQGDSIALGVNAYTGNLTADFAGGRVNAAGPTESVDLHYNSRNPRRDLMGFGWTLGMVDRLEFPADGSVVVAAGAGPRYRFANAGGSYTRPAGVYLNLVHNGNGTWDLTDKAGIKRSFDSSGNETSVSNRNARTRTYTYVAGKLTGVTHPSGLTTAIAYDASNRISTITDAGRVTTLTYNSSNELTKITNADSKDFVFGYDSDHRMTLAKDPLLNQRVPSYYGGGQTDWVGGMSGLAGATFDYGSTGAEFSRTVTDGRSNSTSYVFNTAGAATQVTEPSAPAKYFQRDTDQNVTQITDELGNLWKWTYDSNGNVLTSQDPEEVAASKTRSYVYNSLNQVTSFTDSLTPSHTWTYTYDVKGNRTSIQSPEDAARSKTITYTYDAPGNLTDVTNQLGKVWHYTYDTAGRRLTAASPLDAAHSKTTTYVYDTAGNRTDSTDQLARNWHYTYDALGRRLTIRDPLLQVTTTWYDADGNVTTVRDARNKYTNYTYDAAARITREASPLNHRTWFTYDGSGNLNSVQDPNFETTTYTYDARNRRTQVTTPRGKTTVTAYDAAGRITSVTDASSKTTKYCYDKVGRQTKVIDPRGTETCSTTPVGPYTSVNTYDLMGHLQTSADTSGALTRHCYDADGRQISVTDPRASVSCGTTSSYTTTTTYDDAGRVSTVTEPGHATVTFGYDFDGRPTTRNDGTGTTTRAYDDAGQLTDVTDADGNKASYLYDADGRITDYIDPRGNAAGAAPSQYATHFTYNEDSQITEVRNQLGYKRTTTYDDDGRTIAVTEPRGNVTTPNDPAFTTEYDYDPDGKLNTTTDPDGRVTSLGHDADGNVDTVDDTFGTTNLTWDANQRLSKVVMPDANSSTGGTIVIDRAYDAAGNPFTMADPNGVTTYTYDKRSLLGMVSGPFATATYNDPSCSTCGYDAVGNSTNSKLVTPNLTIARTFDATNRETSVSTWDTATQTYDSRGLPDTHTDGAGYFEDLTTSGAGVPTRLVYKTSSTGTTTADFAITSDEGGRVETVTNQSTTEHTYAYDRAGRLTDEQYRTSPGLQSVTYGYDAAGNRTSKLVSGSALAETYSYSNSGTLNQQAVGGVATATFSYDGNGNQTGVTGLASQSMKWGAGNQLLRVTKGTTIVTLTYDGSGILVKRQVGTTVHPYRYDHNRLEAIQTVGPPPTNTPTDTMQFAYASDGTPLAIRAPGGQIFHYQYDAYGSVDRITQGTTLAVRYVYDSSGNIVETTQGSAYNSLLDQNPFRFMGRHQVKYDPDLNLYELDGRYYDPVIGRYLSRDDQGSYLPCWPGTCAGPAPLAAVGQPVHDPTQGGSCHVGLDMKAEVGYVTERSYANCSDTHAHIVVDFIALEKGYGSPSSSDPSQWGRSYTFQAPDDNGSEHHHESMDPTAPVHAALLHQYSCDACPGIEIPKAMPLGIPCGDTDPMDVPGLPNLWGATNGDGTTNGVAKACGGREWYGITRVHFIPAYAVKNPTDGHNNYLFNYQYKPDTFVKNTPDKACGVHEYPGGKNPNDPAGNVAYGVSQIISAVQHGVGGVRDFAAYNMGVGVICYVDAMIPARG